MDRNNFSQANGMNQARTKNSYSLMITKKAKIDEQIFIYTNDVRWLRNKLRQAPVRPNGTHQVTAAAHT